MGNFLPWYFIFLFSSHFTIARACGSSEDRACVEGELPAGTPTPFLACFTVHTGVQLTLENILVFLLQSQ